MSSQPYPRTWTEFLDQFSSEDACLAYLEGLRWPNGFICPSCGVASVPYRASRIRMMCKDCGHQSTVTAGTIFDKTRTSLRVWLAAAWYLTHQKQGVSALGLQRVLGLGSYQTAWAMLHRFRRAMVRPDRDRLKGVPFVQASVEPGTQVRTDGSAAYRSLASLGYAHQRNVLLGADEPAHVTLAGVHRVASLVKRWILGTHHGAVQPEHLDAYLDEFVFRFNRRTSGSRGMLFYRLLQQAVVTDPVTYADIVVPGPEQLVSA